MKYKNDTNMALVAMIPAEYKGGFGAGWVHKYVSDRLAPIASTITPANVSRFATFAAKPDQPTAPSTILRNAALRPSRPTRWSTKRCLTPTRRNASILNEHSGGTGRKMGWCDGTTQGTFVTWLPAHSQEPVLTGRLRSECSENGSFLGTLELP